MSTEPRALGWLAPIAAVPPAAALGAAVWSEAPAIGAAIAAAIGAGAGLFVARRRRPSQALHDFFAFSMVASTLAFGGSALATMHASAPIDPFDLSARLVAGALVGMAYGVVIGAALALVLRARSLGATGLFAVGLGWTVVPVSLALVTKDPGRLAALVGILGWLGAVASLRADLQALARSSAGAGARERAARTPAPFVRRALVLLGPGYAIGAVVLERVVPGHMLRAPGDLMLAALVPALLASLVGAFGLCASGRGLAARAPFAGVVAGFVCAPLTYLVLRASGSPPLFGQSVLRELFFVAIDGGMLGAPLGLALGVSFVPALALVSRLGRGVHARTFERAAAGALWILAASLAAIPLALGWDGPRCEWARRLPEAVHGVLAIVLLGGVALGAPAWARAIRAVGFVCLARRGRLAGWAVVHRAALDADDATVAALPAYLPLGDTDGVLVRLGEGPAAPFRSASMPELVARVPAPRGRGISIDPVDL